MLFFHQGWTSRFWGLRWILPHLTAQERGLVPDKLELNPPSSWPENTHTGMENKQHNTLKTCIFIFQRQIISRFIHTQVLQSWWPKLQIQRTIGFLYHRRVRIVCSSEPCVWDSCGNIYVIPGAKPFHSLTVADIGDVFFSMYDVPNAMKQIEEAYKRHLSTGCKLLTLGGDHSITYPILRAYKVKWI